MLTAGILALTACACAVTTATATADDNGDGGRRQSDVKVGMAYDVGGRGDQSFNDSAAAGLDQAVEEFGIESEESEAEDGEAETAREERLRTFADAGYDPIIAVGFAYAASLDQGRPGVPGRPLRDHRRRHPRGRAGDNVASLVFAEEQGSFLVGAAAALKSEAGHVGFIGGVETPLIQKFQAGYVAGAEAVNPDIKIDLTYLTRRRTSPASTTRPRARRPPRACIDGGADVVYHAAGGSGGGVFEAARGRRRGRSVSTPTSTTPPTRRSRTSS